jgi:hypothetical protein
MTDTFFAIPDEKYDRFLPNRGWDREDEALVALGAWALVWDSA